VGDFEFRVPPAPHRAPTSDSGQADRNTRGPPAYTVTSEHRQKLGRNRSAGVPGQDVANATTLTRTKDNYWLDHFSWFYDRSNGRRRFTIFGNSEQLYITVELLVLTLSLILSVFIQKN